MSPTTELDEFLMDNLNEVCEIIDDDALRAYAVITTICAAGQDVPESMLKLYVAPLAIDPEILGSTMASFMGMGILNVMCDCQTQSYNCFYEILLKTPSFPVGVKSLQDFTPNYQEALAFVVRLRELL